KLRGGDGKLDVASHVFLTFLQGFANPGKGIVQQLEFSDLGACVCGKPGDPESLEGANRAPPFGERRPNAVGTIAEGSHRAQTGYDYSAFGTKHEELVDLRRGWAPFSPRRTPFTIKLMQYYCFEWQGLQHKLGATLKFSANYREIVPCDSACLAIGLPCL